MTTVERTEDRSKRTTLWYDLVGDDPHPAPDHLRERFPYSPRSLTVPVARYTSREWHLREREHLRDVAFEFRDLLNIRWGTRGCIEVEAFDRLQLPRYVFDRARQPARGEEDEEQFDYGETNDDNHHQSIGLFQRAHEIVDRRQCGHLPGLTEATREIGEAAIKSSPFVGDWKVNLSAPLRACWR